eukprot:263918-Amphidinium_carterae.1
MFVFSSLDSDKELDVETQMCASATVALRPPTTIRAVGSCEEPFHGLPNVQWLHLGYSSKAPIEKLASTEVLLTELLSVNQIQHAHLKQGQ